jgi:hypothetical protein
MKRLVIDTPQEAPEALIAASTGYEPPSVTAHHVAQTVQGNGSQDPDTGAAFPGFL